MKNISILFPKSDFTSEQLQKLSFAGQVTFIECGKEDGLEEMIKTCRGADIIAFPAEKLGKMATPWLLEILEKVSTIKAVALNTTHSYCVDRAYCIENEITVTTVPDHSTEAVAEHIVGLLVATAKRIIINDRRTYSRKYVPELGFNIRGKTLGIINVDGVGERVATIAKAFGMQVLLYNEAPFRMEGTERQSLDEVLYKSDLLVLNLPNIKENELFLNKERIGRLKDKAIVINMAGKELVDEKAMCKALIKGTVAQYVFESLSMRRSPLENIETAIRLKPFSKLTIDSLMMNREWVVKNVQGLSVGKPYNRVSL